MLLFYLLLSIGSLLQTKADSFNEINALQDKTNLRFDELLKAEKVMIDTLRTYIATLEKNINVIKSKTKHIKDIHENSGGDIDAYMNNPLNALSILNRFVVDWPEMEYDARNAYNTTTIFEESFENLNRVQHPSETDYDNALENLLTMQNYYGVDHFAVQFNDIDFGSKFSWSDCLEIGRKSNNDEEYKVAKFWMETAMERLQAASNQTNNSEFVKSKSKILETILNTEYRAGKFKDALNIAQQLSQMHPNSKTLQKAIVNINRKMTRNQRVNPNAKPKLDQKFREEHYLCRASTSRNNSNSLTARQNCQLIHDNLPYLIIQPLRIELLSEDPYIILVHDVLAPQSIDGLHQPENFKLSIFAQNNLLDIIGHRTKKLSPWHVQRYTHTDSTAFVGDNDTRIVAHLIFGLQSAKLGGSIIFPHLQKNVQLSKNTMLYFSNLNEFGEVDQRSRHHFCPVIIGVQINAQSALVAT